MNKQQAIERLKGIVDFYKLNDENNYDYSDEVLISMRIALEEIERLKEDYLKEKYLVDKYTRQLTDEYKNTEYQCKEKERLNNIINELEKWLKERLETLDIIGYDDDIFNGIELVLYKLQELKGSDKE